MSEQLNKNNNIEFSLETIREGLSAITFNKPLKIDAYLGEDEAGFKYVDVNFDFGLSYEFGLYPFYIRDLPLDDWVERTKRIVEFELFHSFFHPSQDPNYSTLNWALFGNLAGRVICSEKWEFGSENQVEIWKYVYKYDGKISKVMLYF